MKYATPLWLLSLILLLPAHAAEKGGSETARDKAPPTETAGKAASEKLAVTHHSLWSGGRTLQYTATAGYLRLKDDSGKPEANIFFVAYVEKGAANIAARPITFAFNGGPGASSMWLHMGGLGPKRVPLAHDGTALPETIRAVDNEYSWLDFTDLVFFDPVGTGYSRAAEGVDPKPFYDVVKDIETAGKFIRLYVTQNERWLSPTFIVGESYGTTRAAGLAHHLQDTAGISLKGIVLLSSALSFEAISFDTGNDLPYALALPSYTATAWYHKKLAPELQQDLAQALSQAEQWATTEYLVALAKGDSLSDAERRRVIDLLARYTGLSKNYLQASSLRVNPSRFRKELLRAGNRAAGLLDSRVEGIDMPSTAESSRYDPALFLATSPYVAALNDYLRRDLKYQTTMPYEVLSREANRSWKWGRAGQGYLYVADDLAEALSRDKRIRVFSAAGTYDLATPYLSQKYTLDHLGIDPSLRRNITFKLYPSGHQIYTDPASLKKLSADVAAFVKGRLD